MANPDDQPPGLASCFLRLVLAAFIVFYLLAVILAE